jgi:hypothetical protein
MFSPLTQTKPLNEFTMPNSTLIRRYIYSDLNGYSTFNFDFMRNLPGMWKVQAKLSSDNVYLPSTSESRQFIVNDTILNIIVSFLTTYFIYIIATAGGTAGAVGFFVYWRRRGG